MATFRLELSIKTHYIEYLVKHTPGYTYEFIIFNLDTLYVPFPIKITFKSSNEEPLHHLLEIHGFHYIPLENTSLV